MKYAKILLALWLAGGTEIVVAGSFADSFRNFILGQEAQAHPAPENLVDKIAGECLGCHNGSTAKNVNVRYSWNGAPSHGFSMDNDHPVGMVYEESVRNKPRGYWPASIMNPDIRLVDGRVACITCHKVKNETAALNETLSSAQPAKPQCTVTKELTTGHSRDELCLSCHVK